MFYSTRFNLISSFIGVSFLVGIVSLIVGGRIIDNAVRNEAENRMSQELNAAYELFKQREDEIALALNVITLDHDFRRSLKNNDTLDLFIRLQEISNHIDLDFGGVYTSANSTICRMGTSPTCEKVSSFNNPMGDLALDERGPVSGTVKLTQDFLKRENPELAEQAKMEINSPTTGISESQNSNKYTDGMAVTAAVPLYEDGEPLGVVYGGILLNKDNSIVDKVIKSVFQREIFKEKNVGTATIFLRDLRIATNVMNFEGQRAIGTRVSTEVKNKVLIGGERWTDRAFVVNSWYITAYRPVEDIFGDRIGMLAVGVLEEKYDAIRNRAITVFAIITLAGVIVAAVLGYILGRRLFKPVHRLIEASKEVSQGELSPEIGPMPKGEIGVLQQTFTEMLESLRERDRQQKADSEIKLLQSEKQASIGRLAAGVAHEINNPLTGVLTFTHMLLRRDDLAEDIKEDLNTIVGATERVREIVKGLLDFSRQTEIKPELTDINALIRKAMNLVENQALVKGVMICFDPEENLPKRTIDVNQMESVIINILINAIDSMEPGGHIIINTSLTLSTEKYSKKGIEITIIDTGCGISPENLDKLFEPFFTTKEVGKGTGLGLSVSYGIVERHGGTIRVKSKVGQGSTFIIWLPLEEKT
jgi:two-component system, NtrC family, sensor kinase